jgi:dipeptidyl-peptidase-4
MRFDTRSQKQKVLLTESSDTWVNLHDDLYFLKNKQQQFVWASEKDGFKHLYLYNKDGKMKRQITSGDWVVDDVVAIDEDKKHIYFTGRKDTPIEKHLYRVSWQDSKIEKITQRSGFHNVTFSKDASAYVDKYSHINAPPQVSLHSNDGKQLSWLYENAVSESHPLAPYQDNWVKPSFGTFKNEEGITLHYRLYRPETITEKMPVIVYVYGGPHAQVVTNQWAGNRGLLMQHWVDKGYLVFSVDNRGSNYRGKGFEDPIYQDMGNVEVKDQVSGVKFLHTLPYVDKDRIGIHGHSYGGYMTLMAMFKAPNYFAAGVSGAPVTDWLLYDTHYTERYMGNPNEVMQAYTDASVFPYADALTGDLLIYHGMADDNVLFKHSTKLYKTLQDQGKLFEVMDYPGKKHSIRGKGTGIHLYRTITDFFDRSIGSKRPQ